MFFMVFFMCLLFIIGVICFIASATAFGDCDDKAGSILLLICIICIFLSVYIGRELSQQVKNEINEKYTQSIQTKTYKTELGIIEGVYVDKIQIKNGYEYILNQDSQIKDLTIFKPSDMVEIKYVENNDGNIIITIEKLK